MVFAPVRSLVQLLRNGFVALPQCSLRWCGGGNDLAFGAVQNVHMTRPTITATIKASSNMSFPLAELPSALYWRR
jgi:hypothetical protein